MHRRLTARRRIGPRGPPEVDALFGERRTGCRHLAADTSRPSTSGPAPLDEELSSGARPWETTEGPAGVEISYPDYRTTVWGHGGFLPGFRSALWYLPQHDVVIVVLTNDSRANSQDLAELALHTVIHG